MPINLLISVSLKIALLEWQHLKKDELCGQIFDDELDLAYGVIDGVKARGQKDNYSTERIKFDSNPSG